MRRFSDRNYRSLASRVMGRSGLERLHFPHECALWKPGVLDRAPSGESPSRIKASDARGMILVGRVRCFYNATPETNQAQVMGRTMADNIFTMDKFILPDTAEVDDQWVLCYLSPGGNFQNLYAIQGAPQTVNPGPLHPIGGKLVMGKLLPKAPPGVRVEEALKLQSVLPSEVSA